MRILIVEDQQIILAGIQKMISGEMDCDLDAALSGEEAMQRIAAAPAPDAILTDIVMPGMDGLAFIRQAKELLPYCRFIILSGYDSFSFAQTAIHLGVTDYLLKPLERKKLMAALETIREEGERQWRLRRETCLADFLQAQVSPQTAFPRLEGMTGGANLVAGFYCVRGGAQDLREALPGCYFMGGQEGFSLYLTLLPQSAFSAVHGRLMGSGGQVSFGVDASGQVVQALLRCAEADDNRFFPERGADAPLCTAELRRLDDALAAGDGETEMVETAVEAFFSAIAQANGPAREVRRAVLWVLNRLLGEGNEGEMNRAWQTAASYGAFLAQMRGMLRQRILRRGEDTAVERMKSYIHAHCAQPLTVRQVAQAVALSPNYASAIFKKETDEALSAYIRRRQMEVARHLLLSTDMRVYEIAEQLGYSDEKHFSALFRMHYQESPNAVRRGGRTRQT